jgi:hypothetical protein
MMDNTENQQHWHDLYTRAMQEPDPTLLAVRNREAQQSVGKKGAAALVRETGRKEKNEKH